MAARIVGVVTLLVVSLMISVPAARQAADCRPDDSESLGYVAIIGAGLAVAGASFIAMTTRLRWRVVAALVLGLLGAGLTWVWLVASWMDHCLN
jgi:hypothetical protein